MKSICALLLLALLVATPAGGHEGHDHGAAPAAPAGAPTPRLESEGAELELVAKLVGHELVIYLDRLATNEPVDGATIEVTGDGIAPATAESAGSGTYEVDVPWADEPGAHPLIFTVTAGGTMDLLNGVLQIPAPEKAPQIESSVFASPAAWALSALAALLGFLAAFAVRSGRSRRSPSTARGEQPSASPEPGTPRLKRVSCVLVAALAAAALLPSDAHAHGGDEHGDEQQSAAPNVDAPHRLAGGDAFVPKQTQRLLRIRTEVAKPQAARKGRELIGAVVPDPSSFGQVQAPMDGRIELAKRGISHVGQKVAAGELLALLAPTIPVADLGTMQQLTAEVEGKLNIAEQKLARLTRISSVIAQKEIDDTKTEIDALRKQKRVLTPKDAQLIELKAPVGGIISVANVRAGQVVTARDTLFEIVDPARLWVEAISSSEHDTSDIAAAHATDADGHVIPLSYIGRAPALRQQSLPLQFKVEGAHEGLPIGTTVKVVAQYGAPIEGIVLPDAAVVRGANGLPQVWSKVSAETFKPLPVRTVPIDGAHVLVLAGIAPGTRIVIDGAELINQVR